MTGLVAREVGRWACPEAHQVLLSVDRIGPVREVFRAAVRDGGRVALREFAPGTGIAAVEASFPEPWAGDGATGFVVGPRGDFAVFVGDASVCAVGADGTRLWETAFPQSVTDDMASGSAAVTRDGRHVWLHLPAEAAGEKTDQWRVVRGADGVVVAETRLECVALGSEHYVHPDGVHIGLSVGEGQDGSWLLWGRLAGDELRWWSAGQDLVLADLSRAGDRYLTIDQDQTGASVHAFPDGQVLGRVDSDAAPRDGDPGEDEEPYWDFYAGFVDDTTVVLSDVESDEDKLAGHWRLDTATATLLGEIDYPAPVTGYPRPLGDGTWLTATEDQVRRWTFD